MRLSSMKEVFVFLLVLALISSEKLFSQHYRLAGGIRVGDNYGLSLQGRLFGCTSAEAMLHPGIGNQYNNVSLVIKQHQKIITDRLNIYGGAGIMQSWKQIDQDNIEYYKTGGIRGIVGAELTIGRYNLSWDFAPGLHLWGNESGKFTGGSAISVRYVLIKQPRKKINLKFWK